MSLLLDALNQASKAKAAGSQAFAAASLLELTERDDTSFVAASPEEHEADVALDLDFPQLELISIPTRDTPVLPAEPPVEKVAEPSMPTATQDSPPPVGEYVSVNTPQMAETMLRAKATSPKRRFKKRWLMLGVLVAQVAVGMGLLMTGRLDDVISLVQSSPLLAPATPTMAPLLKQKPPKASPPAVATAPSAPVQEIATAPTVPVRQGLDRPRPNRRPDAAIADKQEGGANQTSGALLQGRTKELSTLEQGYLALTQGRWQEAKQAYLQALRGNAEEVNALLGLAYVSQQQGQQVYARDYYQRVLRQEPGNPVALAGLLALGVTDDSPELASHVRELAANNPDSAAAQSALGNSLVRQGWLAQGQQAFYRAFMLEPFVALHAFNLAVALDQLRNYEQARSFYERAIALAEQSGGEQASGVSYARVRTRLSQLQPAAATLGAGSP
jgi:tetratricopeptide (TPR) repeat protein